MAKKENILDYLDKGTSEDITVKDGWDNDVECVRVKVGNFEYTYPKYDVDKYGEKHDFRPELKKRWDAENRRESHYQNRGCNYSHPSRVNDIYLGGLEFAQKMKYLADNRQVAPLYFAVYCEACKAPTRIQPFVYENLLQNLRKDKVKGITETICFDVVERMPPAFRKGWENVDLHGFTASAVAEDLLPAAGYEIGKKCYVKHSVYDVSEGVITGYDYEMRKNGFYGIKYVVKTVHDYCFSYSYKLNEIHFVKYAAV